MNLQDTFLKKLISILMIILLCTPSAPICNASSPAAYSPNRSHVVLPTRRGAVYKLKKAHTLPSTRSFAVKFFPIITKPRKFFVKGSMIKTLAPLTRARITIADFEERVDIIALETIRILDIGDPEKLPIKRTRDFDEIYRRYIKLSQKLASFNIKNIPRPSREAMDSLPVCHDPITCTELESIRSKVEPLNVEVTEWYKTPIELALDEKQELNSRQVAAWYATSKYAHIIATQCRGVGFLLRCMHNIFMLLPEIFPEVESA